MQCINVFFGGSLYQDIKSLLPEALNHEKGSIHLVEILSGTHLKKTIKKPQVKVKSFHHQAINKIGKGLNISAKSKDNIVEGIESQDGTVLAVQWHPELENSQVSSNLFNYFINKSSQNLN